MPAAPRSPSHDVAAALAAHAAVRERLVAGRGLALDRLMIVSPFAARVRYNVFVALALVPTHARRHLWQAERARDATASTPDVP